MARGMVFSGLRASAPSVAALSNPTKLKMESTSAGPSEDIDAPLSLELIHIEVQAEANRQHRKQDDDQRN